MARHGDHDNRFDVSDDDAGPIDTMNEILDVAASVLADYGPDPGSTRLERLARWVVDAVGGEPGSIVSAGAVAKVRLDTGISVLMAGDVIALQFDGRVVTPQLSSDDARELAVALLRVAEYQERRE